MLDFFIGPKKIKAGFSPESCAGNKLQSKQVLCSHLWEWDSSDYFTLLPVSIYSDGQKRTRYMAYMSFFPGPWGIFSPPWLTWKLCCINSEMIVLIVDVMHLSPLDVFWGRSLPIRTWMFTLRCCNVCSKNTRCLLQCFTLPCHQLSASLWLSEESYTALSICLSLWAGDLALGIIGHEITLPTFISFWSPCLQTQT